MISNSGPSDAQGRLLRGGHMQFDLDRWIRIGGRSIPGSEKILGKP